MIYYPRDIVRSWGYVFDALKNYDGYVARSHAAAWAVDRELVYTGAPQSGRDPKSMTRDHVGSTSILLDRKPNESFKENGIWRARVAFFPQPETNLIAQRRWYPGAMHAFSESPEFREVQGSAWEPESHTPQP